MQQSGVSASDIPSPRLFLLALPGLLSYAINARQPATPGSALWLDAPSKSRCLILWRRLPDVAAAIADWASTYGVSDSVMLVDELANGAEVTGTELEGMHREVLVRALQILETQGRVK